MTRVCRVPMKWPLRPRFAWVLIDLYPASYVGYKTRNPVAFSGRLEPSRVRVMQMCSPLLGRPGRDRAAAGLHFGLRASVSAQQYGNRAPVRPRTVIIRLYDTLAHLVNCPGCSIVADCVATLQDLINEMPSGDSVVCKQLNTAFSCALGQGKCPSYMTCHITGAHITGYLLYPPSRVVHIPDDDGADDHTVRSRYKRELIRLNMKKKWPTRTEMEDSRPIFFCKRFSYNENALLSHDHAVGFTDRLT